MREVQNWKAVKCTGKDSSYLKKTDDVAKHPNGYKRIYRYVVTGSAESKEAYAAAQGDGIRFLNDDPSKPIFFTDRADVGASIDLYLSNNGQVNINTELQERALGAIQGHAGTVVGDKMAEIYAQRFMADLFSTPSAPVQEPAKTQASDTEEMGGM